MKITVGIPIELAVNVLQLTSSSDFQSAKPSIAHDEPGMNLSWLFQTPDGVVTQTQVTPTAPGGDYDWTHVGEAMYKIGMPASGGGSINNDAKGCGWFRGTCRGVLPWASPIFEFVPENITGALVKGTSKLETDAVSIDGNRLAAQVLAAKNFATHDEAYVVVAEAATDALRGTALGAAYAAAKALTPGGEEISVTNRAAVLIPPGRYALTSTLDLNTDGVDLIALVPEMGGARMLTDCDSLDGGASPLSTYRPPSTEIYATINTISTVTQSTANVRMVGFAIAQLAFPTATGCRALYVSATSNEGSVYQDMYFWHRAPGTFTSAFPVGFAKDVKGVWIRCIANAYAWRVGHDVGQEAVFSAAMYDCQAGTDSFLGDAEISGSGVTTRATGCVVIRCASIGAYYTAGNEYGKGSFGGCSLFGLNIAADCYFEDSIAGVNSFGLGSINAGTFVRCRGGDYCFGSTIRNTVGGEFSGKAYDCIGGKASFGGEKPWTGDSTGKLSGILVNCISKDSELPWRAEGATIEGCLLTVVADGEDCIILLDSLSRIHNSTLLVLETGTGIPINAASALTVSAAGNRFNNSDTDPDGLGANVTNLGITQA